MIDDRRARILEAAIREFISTGEPVSSDELYEQYQFGIKPASIRAELLCLTHDGLLEQLHTSGGRVPTERGYELFVNQLLLKFFSDEEETEKPGVFEEENLSSVVDRIADELKLLGVGYELHEGEMYKNGLDELCNRIDAETREEFLEVVRDVEGLDKKLAHIAHRLRAMKKPEVFIGGKSPVTKSKKLAVILDSYNDEHGRQIVIAAIGPKRMDYAKPLKLFKEMRKKYKK